MNKMPKFYMIFVQKILFHEFWESIPGSKAESE